MAEERIDFRILLRKALGYWYVFVIIFPLAVGMAYYFLQTTQPEYQANALLLVKSDEHSGQLSEESLFKELGVGRASKNLENEKAILGSSPMMLHVVQKLELQYDYTQLGNLQRYALYNDSPVRVSNWQPNPGDEYFEGVVRIDSKGGFTLETELEGQKREFSGEFGKSLALPVGNLTLTFIGDNEIDTYPIEIRIAPAEDRAKELVQMLTVEIVSKEASILSMNMRDVARQRAKDVLTTLIEVYNEKTVDSENRVFVNTIDLINERIQYITDELTEAEKDVEAYKQRFNMVELSTEGTLLMNDLADYNKQISQTEVQLTILNSIEETLQKNSKDFEFVPTNLSLNNLTLAGQLESFNVLLVQKQQKSNELGPAHPDLKLIDKQLGNLRQTIIENIQAMKKDLVVARDANTSVKNAMESRLQSLPRRERELIEIERRKSVKENLYLYLLQKREESVISMAITMPKGIIIEPPVAGWTPVSPRPIQIWLVAIFLGLALPAGLVLLLTQLDDKIHTEEDIEHLSSVPVAGVLSLGKKNQAVVVRENSRSVAAEMFRMLRANLAYILPGQNLRSLLITSATSGEGKSFISLNLGITLALAGKRVVILEMDLRKPRKVADPQSNGQVAPMGIVNYLVEPSTTLDQIISSSEYHPNLDVIICGPKPPNPSELVLSERLRQMIDELKLHYDILIIDTPPVGIVADALQMKDLADATLFITRAGYTPKVHLNIVNNIAEKNKLPRPFIILNGVRLQRYYGYGSYGGYTYNYVSNKGYFEKEA